MDTCKKMIEPQPKIGAANRHPDARCCKYTVWKDGFCKKHHPERVAEKEREKEDFKKRWAKPSTPAVLNIDNAILLLIDSGYRVEKPTF